ncbi:hypothetical protein C0992_007889 [Termitomyces sp. T32_za158]|nr:hypothetical protein C0992_007889 [Termitomyces sp. T32_za158]
MPGKHVRFADEVIHYPLPPAPSISSLPSSSLRSPLNLSSPSPTSAFPPRPGVFSRPSPYTTPLPLPPKPIQLHALLRLSNSPVLNFDLRQPPSTITSQQRRIQLRTLSEPATHPPLAALIIVIHHLPWSLTVYPSRRLWDRTFVTVEDVLQQLYDMLRTGISSREFHSLLSDKDRSRVAAAYGERYRRIAGPRESEDEKRGGVRRVDLLESQTRFMGLTSSTTRPDVWVLHSA